MPKKPLGFLLCFWFGYLCVPALRENLRVIASPGTAMSDSTFDGLYGQLDALVLPDKTPAESPIWLDADNNSDIIAHPHSDLRAETLYPRDARVLAWLLTDWTVESDDEIPAENGEPATSMVRMALRGEKLDPGNAYFPWMAAQAHLALDEDEDAVADLRKAISLPRYDGYIRDYFTDAARYDRADGGGSVGRTYYLMFSRNPPSESITQNLQRQLLWMADGPATISLTRGFEPQSLMLLLGRLQRTRATTATERFYGACLEYGAISPDSILAGTLIPFQTPPWGQPPGFLFRSHLFLAAGQLHRPDIQSTLIKEWAVLSQPSNLILVPRTTAPNDEVMDIYGARHFERLILWSFPACIFLLLVNARGAPGGTEVSNRGRPGFWQGALAGLCGLALLALGDCAVAAERVGALFQTANFALWAGPGLPAVKPFAALSMVAIFLVAGSLGYSILGRSETAPLPRDRSTRWPNFLFVFRSFALFNFWVWITGWFLYTCWMTFVRQAGSNLNPNPAEYPHSPLNMVLFVLVAYLPWWLAKLPDRPRAKDAARLWLRAAVAGYLVAATALFLGLELFRIPHQMAFDAAVQQVLQNGG